MVHFPPLPSPSYEFRGRYSGINQSGFPHSEIPGSKPACGSPGLIAACHVLHRLLAPRHSPYALSSLTKCSHAHCVCVVKELPIAGYSVVKEPAVDGLQRRSTVTLVSRRPALRRSPQTFHCRAPRGALQAGRFCVPSCGSISLPSCSRRRPRRRRGQDCSGEYRARTGDLLVANQALSQLS
jgi:hypothetical protein